MSESKQKSKKKTTKKKHTVVEALKDLKEKVKSSKTDVMNDIKEKVKCEKSYIIVPADEVVSFSDIIQNSLFTLVGCIEYHCIS